MSSAMYVSSGRSSVDVLSSVSRKSIEEVMISRKATSVLSQRKPGHLQAAHSRRDNTFLERERTVPPSLDDITASYKSYLNSTVGGSSDSNMQEAYNTMRDRCLVLTERLMEMEKVAHKIQIQRDQLLDRKDKSVELQTRVHDCSVGLEYLDSIFKERDGDLQSDSATSINAVVRGFLIRQRARKAEAGMRHWRSAQVQVIKSATMRFLAMQKVKMHNVNEISMRRQGTFLTRVVLQWRAHTAKKRPERQKYRAKHDIVKARHLALIMRTALVEWHTLATGVFSSKAVAKSYQQRRRRAELRLLGQQEQTGEPPEITEDLIDAEVAREAVEHISEKHYAFKLSGQMTDWKDAGKIKIAKSHFGSRLCGLVVKAWFQKIETIKGSDEHWLQEHQTRVKMRIFFRQLQIGVWEGWAYFARTRAEVTRRFRHIALEWMRIVFDEFRSSTSSQHETRDFVIARLEQKSRSVRGDPFCAWVKLTHQQEVWRFAVSTFTNHTDRRQKSMMLRWGFDGWKSEAFQSNAADAGQLLASVEDLQSANEALKSEHLNAVAQAERAVAQSKAQLLEKEQRAEVAEKTAQEAQLELQRLKEELLKIKQQKQAQDAMLEARSQIGSAKTPPAAPEPEPAPLEPKPSGPGTMAEVSYEELLLLNRAKWAIDQFQDGKPYVPPQEGGSEGDVELARVNHIVEVLCDASRKNQPPPPNTRLPPMKPPSREALVDTGPELEWDEFLTGLDEFDQGKRAGSSSGGSRPNSRASSNMRPGSRGL